ncbi:FIG00003370: Multicopper polyphenol oxidase [hydrothermal vent metagenome]|uniref:FIG00003370: Multicopper polyphenol oxidase n=1 Tax=hydrothermal vent metagenome TaxID=652676 RepID=A0A3B0VAZ2_9ZZZZ
MIIITPDIFTNTAIKALQTTRLGGSSTKFYASMNLGVFGNDKSTQANIHRLKTTQNLPHLPVFMQQIHTNKVIEYTDLPKQHGDIQADACFTRAKNIICAVLSADCLPVLIADKHATVVAAVHCGWRGLYADILTKTIKRLKVDSKELVCWLGPCISYKPYRVDAQFREKFVTKNLQSAHCFYRNKKGGWHADLKKIALYQLESLGVATIAQSPYCTYDNKSMFYSYRRDGETGRMASMIWISPKH